MTPEAFAQLQAQVDEMREELDVLINEGVPGRGYQPVPAPRWWLLRDEPRADAITRLASWVETVYTPSYGTLAAKLPPCWREHPLALFALDWLAELHSVLYLQPVRLVSHLGGQAEWTTRFLPAVAEMIAAEARSCEHGRRGGPIGVVR